MTDVGRKYTKSDFRGGTWLPGRNTGTPLPVAGVMHAKHLSHNFRTSFNHAHGTIHWKITMNWMKDYETPRIRWRQEGIGRVMALAASELENESSAGGAVVAYDLHQSSV